MSGPEQEQQKPRCWSYSASTLERCALPAGHSGEHEVVRYTRWDDVNAWTPDHDAVGLPRPAVPYVAEDVPLEDTAIPTDLLDVDQDPPGPAGCYNCPHPEHDGPCTYLVTSQNIECGCTFRSL